VRQPHAAEERPRFYPAAAQYHAGVFLTHGREGLCYTDQRYGAGVLLTHGRKRLCYMD
jgi:hypothetical protein